MADGKQLAQNTPPLHHQIDEEPLLERREYERVNLFSAAFATNAQGHELGRVTDVSGGGMLLEPASPWARKNLVQGQQLVVTVTELSSGNQTDMYVGVRYVDSIKIGLRFL